MKGIDTPNRITPDIAAKITDDFVCLYLMPEYVDYLKKSMAWKRMLRSDAEALTAAGKWILSVFESTERRALSGRDGGKYDGRMVLKEAQDKKQPPSSAICFAVDYDAPESDFGIIFDYLIGAQAELLEYKVGCYGHYELIEYLGRRGVYPLWQTYAWSHNKLSRYANVYQYKNGTNLYGLSCDSNYSYGGEGFWNLDGVLKNTLTDNGGVSMTDWDKKAVEFVKKFQAAIGITVDGKAGYVTNEKLDEILKPEEAKATKTITVYSDGSVEVKGV